jgi:hypothetical protein
MIVYIVSLMVCVSSCFVSRVGVYTTQEKGIEAIDHDLEKRKADGDIVGTDFTSNMKDGVYTKKSIKNNRIWEFYEVEPVEVQE